MRKKEINSGEIESLIFPGVVIKGDLSSQGSIRVDGSLEGNIDIKGNLLLGEKGTIKGEVKAANFILAGKMEGTVKVESRLEITNTGVMLGDISSKIITIEEGGIIQGTTQMTSLNKESVPNKEV